METLIWYPHKHPLMAGLSMSQTGKGKIRAVRSDTESYNSYLNLMLWETWKVSFDILITIILLTGLWNAATESSSHKLLISKTLLIQPIEGRLCHDSLLFLLNLLGRNSFSTNKVFHCCLTSHQKCHHITCCLSDSEVKTLPLLDSVEQLFWEF